MGIGLESIDAAALQELIRQELDRRGLVNIQPLLAALTALSGAQIGTGTWNVPGTGVQDLSVALPKPWPNNHTLFLAGINPQANASVGGVYFFPVDLGHGDIRMLSSPGAQAVSYWWLSCGN